MTHPPTRRDFLGSAALATGLLLSNPSIAPAASEDRPLDWPKMPPVKIHVVYVGLGGAWPKPEFDAPAEVAKFQTCLRNLQQRIGDVQFVGGQLISNSDPAAAQLAANIGKPDALLIVHLAFGSGLPLLKLVDTALPTAIFSQPFSGHDWMYVPQWQKAGKRVMLFTSSDYADLDRAVALLRVPARMRQSRILLVGEPHGTAPARSPEKIKQRLGTEIVPITAQQIIEAHQAIDPKAAEDEAETYWIKPARKVVEPPRDEIVNSARLFLAVKKLMIDHRAQAITSSLCMGKPAKGCLTFSKLNDLGYVGACEGDVDSTLTMLIFAYAFRRPGFITDPLFDTSKNAVIHAHCVASTRMDGPDGQRAPFAIRTHRDDSTGVAVQVELRVGQEITSAKLVNLDTMLLSAQKIIEIPSFDDRGCRTQIIAQIPDAPGMLQNWGSGLLDNECMMTQLHRVVFYGNHVENVRHLANLMGLKIVMES